MSLQNLATQMAAQGRGPDRTLVHMSPKEVQGLQALAMAHGGSLTINPVTGLPEAGFLESILPAVAGFALNAFAPGVGTAVGGMLGLGEAAGTALTVGGIAGLASGSLEKGIMAGMGAYGGASLGGSLGDMGSAVNARAANEAAQVAGLGDAERVAAIQAAAKPDISAGFSAAASNPKDFLQDNKFAIGAAFLPALMGGMDDKGEGTGAPKTPKYIRRYETDPVTGEIRQAQAISTDDFGDQPAVSFGGVKRMADGGPVTFGGVPASTKVIDPYDTRTDSQKSLDYLMGKGANPMLFTHKKATGPIEPADMLTRKGGHYVLDAATNTYVWVPDDTAAADAAAASLAAKEGLAALDRRGGGRGEGISTGPTGTGADAQGNVSTGFGGFTLGPDGKVTANQTPAILGSLPIIGSFFNYQNEKARQAAEAYGAVLRDTDPNFNGQPVEGSPTATAGPTGTGGQAAAAAAAAANAATAAGATPAEAAAAAQAAANAAISGQSRSDAVNTGLALGTSTVSGVSDLGTSDRNMAAMRGQNNTDTGFDNSVEGSSGYGQTADGGIDGSMYSKGGIASLAGGGVTGSGNLDLNIPLNVGGGGGGGGGGSYPFTNSGGGSPIGFNGNNNTAGGGFGGNIGSNNGSSLGVDSSMFSNGIAQSRGYGPQGPAQFSPDYLETMNNVRGQPTAQAYANGGITALAGGGLGSLGGYSDGGQLLKGPGDGVSDSIPAKIAGNQPARLADGEFVIPARIVSELGNGSTDAGARELYKMMARIQAGRAKTVGKNKTAVNSKSARHLPA